MNRNIESIREGILKKDRGSLAQAITIIESHRTDDRILAFQLLEGLPRNSSLRIGITGSPGVGKSSFINQLGKALLEKGKSIAILAIDPSSEISGGSILADKTLMADLSSNSNVFIRPSPNSGILGGVNRASLESILLCESAGFDIILIETVGVGQSEIEIKNLSDLVIYLTLPVLGDDLQFLKKGIIEIADIVVINKSDLFEVRVVNNYIQQFKNIIKIKEYATQFFTNSYQKNVNKEMLSFILEQGISSLKREYQNVYWYQEFLKEYLVSKVGLFIKNEKLTKSKTDIPSKAAFDLVNQIDIIFKQKE